MALAYINKRVREWNASGERKGLSSYYAGGMNSLCPITPENVIVWSSSSDGTFDQTIIHQRMILKVILRGSIMTHVDGISIPMKAGEGILFFPQQFHSSEKTNTDEEYEFLAITFTERNNHFSPLSPLKNRVLTIDRKDEKNLSEIFSAFWQLGKTTPSDAICLLQTFLVGQVQMAKNLPETKIETKHGESFPAICDYIRKHFTKRVSLKTIAEEFNLTPHTIRRLFHKHYGDVTPGELIRRLRLQYASELILRSTEPIANIADLCGFKDQFSFSRAFKKATGQSPLNYRKAFQKKSEKSLP